MGKTNKEVLLEYLQKGNIVTTRTAPDEIGIADVRANIRDLRNAGIDVKDRWVESENRRGKKHDTKNIIWRMLNAIRIFY